MPLVLMETASPRARAVRIMSPIPGRISGPPASKQTETVPASASSSMSRTPCSVVICGAQGAGFVAVVAIEIAPMGRFDVHEQRLVIPEHPTLEDTHRRATKMLTAYLCTFL